jgi:hypothetical protein
MVDENENSPTNNLDDDYINEIDEEKYNTMKINKMHKYFLEMKKECLKMGYLQNMKFIDFFNLIGEKN